MPPSTHSSRLKICSVRRSYELSSASVPTSKALVLLLFLLLFVVISFTLGNWPLPSAKSPGASFDSLQELSTRVDEHTLRRGMELMNNISFGVVPFLSPWGDNRLLIFRAWTHIYHSITKEIRQNTTNGNDCRDVSVNCSHQKQLQLLVYDVDDGYFTLSLANFLPTAFVTCVVFDRCKYSLGEPDKCTYALPTVELVERKWKEIRNSNTTIAESRLFVCASPQISTVRLGVMAGRRILADYQVALSLFDYISYSPTKLAFQRALISVLKSASVATFISLPAFGPPPGYTGVRPLRWYELAQEPVAFIQEAAEVFNVNLSVVRLATVRRADGNLTLLRVGVLHQNHETSSVARCEVRKELLRCNSWGLFARCPP